MKTKRIDADSVAAIPQDSDDILGLRRIIQRGDTVSGRTHWVVKQDREYSRPDKGTRIKVMAAVQVRAISLDNTLDRLRIGGTVCESDSEYIPRGTHHSLLVGIGDAVRITKSGWTRTDRRLLKRESPAGFVLAAVDRAECGLARLHGTHMHHAAQIRSGAGGKRYGASFDMNGYFAEITAALLEALQKGDRMILFGPGRTKNQLAGRLAGRPGFAPDAGPAVIEGIDTGGMDGIHLFARSEAFQKALADSRLARVLEVLDRVMAMAGRGGHRFTTGFEDTAAAARRGAVESLAYSDGIFGYANEDDIVSFLNEAESTGVSVYGVDSSTDVGTRITGMGGIISVLRY